MLFASKRGKWLTSKNLVIGRDAPSRHRGPGAQRASESRGNHYWRLTLSRGGGVSSFLFFFFFHFPSKACLFTLHPCRAAPHRGCLAGPSAPSQNPIATFWKHASACFLRPGGVLDRRSERIFFLFLRGSCSPFRAVANQTKRWEGAGNEKKKNGRKKRGRE